MQKIKTFLRSFWLSCTSPTYYAEIIRTHFSFSLKYLLVFQFLTTLVIATFILVPLSQINVLGILDTVKNVYPQDLEITVDDGRLSINQPLPYRIPLPVIMEDQMRPERWADDKADLRYIAVFDSDSNIQGVDDVLSEDAFVVVTETTIYTRDGDGKGLRVNQIPDGESFQLNPDMVNQAFGKITGSTFVQQKLYVPLLGLFFIVVVLPVMIVASLILVAVYGFLVLIMTRLLKGWMLAGQVLSYTKAVQVSIHSLTLINVLHFVLRGLGEGKWLDGGNHAIAFLLWTGFVLYQSFHMGGKSHVTASPVPTTSRTRASARSRKPVKATKAPLKAAKKTRR